MAKKDGLNFGGAAPGERKKKPAPEEPQRPAYVMPEVHVGDIVMYGIDPDLPCDRPALVVRVYPEAVNLLAFQDGFHNGEPVDGVRHAAHPNREAIHSTNAGHWTHTDRTTQMIRLDAELGGLLARLTQLEESLGGTPEAVATPPATT